MITSTLLTLVALATSPIAEAPFRDLTFDQALAAAKKEQRIVMIDFFTTWCMPCKQLDKVTWKDADVQAWIGKTAIALKIDAEKEKELAQRFKIEAYPTILFLKADGTEIDRMLGFREPTVFVQEATSSLAGKDAIARMKEKMAGKPIGPMQRAQLANVMAQSGKYAEALAEYLWCFDHGLEVEPKYGGMRLSILLMSIVGLGNKYPPAMRALEERRDAAEKVFDSGQGGIREAADLAALNQFLKTPERTLALYDRLAKEGKLTPELRSAMFRQVIDLLIAARRYADVIEGTGDVEEAVKQRISIYEEARKLNQSQARDGSQGGVPDFDSLRPEVIDDVGKYYEALLGTQQQKLADSVADILISFDPTGWTFAALVEHALRAGANDSARALVERGMKSLPEKEQARVKRAARKIPEAK